MYLYNKRWREVRRASDASGVGGSERKKKDRGRGVLYELARGLVRCRLERLARTLVMCVLGGGSESKRSRGYLGDR